MAIKVLVDVEAEILKQTGVDVKCDLSQYTDKQLSDAWARAEGLHRYYAQVAGTQKIFMNSIYGATGTIHFPFCNFYTAEDITGEGRYYILAGQKVINEYLNEHWHLDTETHQYLIDKLGADKFTKPFGQKLPTKDYVLYIDTDSIYVEYDELIKSVGYTGFATDIVLALHKSRVKDLFDEKLGALVTKRNGENYLKFDLEMTAAVGFFLKKKKYLLAEEWSDKVGLVFDDPHNHLKGKGIEIAKKEFSAVTIKLIKFVLSEIIAGTLTAENFKAYIRKAYDIFSKINVHECCKFVGLNKTDQYIDYSNESGYATLYRALPQHKGAARYNHLRLKHGVADRYEKLRDGQKIALYIDTNGEWFAFESGNFPEEFAPPIDRLAMFHRVFVKPVTRFAYLAGYDVDNVLSDKTQVRI